MIPETLRWWSATPDGAAWLQRLPRLVGECAAAWELDVGDPLDGYEQDGRWLPEMIAAARQLSGGRARGR